MPRICSARVNPRTRLVAVGCASNASGTINPVREIASLAHEVGALVFVDAVHFAPHVLIDVDMDAAVKQALERYSGDIRTLLRNEKLRYTNVSQEGETVIVKFKDAALRDQAEDVIGGEFRSLLLETIDQGNEYRIEIRIGRTEAQSVRKFALEQNITTLRNRVNALGVAEPIIQQQGDRRIVVQLPGAQDPAKLKEILLKYSSKCFFVRVPPCPGSPNQ